MFAVGRRAMTEAKRKRICVILIRMAVNRCRVSYSDAEGVHSVEVSAETLFEAVAQAVVEFKDDRTVSNPPGPDTDFTVSVMRKPIEHCIRLKRIQAWAEPTTVGGPAEMLRRERVRKMLMGRAS
jgi:hypothetical protein